VEWELEVTQQRLEAAAEERDGLRAKLDAGAREAQQKTGARRGCGCWPGVAGRRAKRPTADWAAAAGPAVQGFPGLL
jgi:hypothetical protein